jgi:hypothetical protein
MILRVLGRRRASYLTRDKRGHRSRINKEDRRLLKSWELVLPASTLCMTVRWLAYILMADQGKDVVLPFEPVHVLQHQSAVYETAQHETSAKKCRRDIVLDKTGQKVSKT